MLQQVENLSRLFSRFQFEIDNFLRENEEKTKKMNLNINEKEKQIIKLKNELENTKTQLQQVNYHTTTYGSRNGSATKNDPYLSSLGTPQRRDMTPQQAIMTAQLQELQEQHTDLLGLLAQQELELQVYMQELLGLGGKSAVTMAQNHAQRMAIQKYGSYTNYRDINEEKNDTPLNPDTIPDIKSSPNVTPNSTQMKSRTDRSSARKLGEYFSPAI
jgi:hypothetical protein